MITLALTVLFGLLIGYALIGPINHQGYTPMQAFAIILTLAFALCAGLLVALTIGAAFSHTSSQSGLGGVAIAYGGGFLYSLSLATGTALRVWKDSK